MQLHNHCVIVIIITIIVIRVVIVIIISITVIIISIIFIRNDGFPKKLGVFNFWISFSG